MINKKVLQVVSWTDDKFFFGVFEVKLSRIRSTEASEWPGGKTTKATQNIYAPSSSVNNNIKKINNCKLIYFVFELAVDEENGAQKILKFVSICSCFLYKSHTAPWLLLWISFVSALWKRVMKKDHKLEGSSRYMQDWTIDMT